MYPHRIRLHGPWDVEPLRPSSFEQAGLERSQSHAPPPAPFRQTMPCAWHELPIGEFSGRIRFSRVFHQPRSVAVHERLWLWFEGIDLFSTISLNGTLLVEHLRGMESFEFDVTELISQRNVLEIQADTPGDDEPDCLSTGLGQHVGGLWGSVALLVRHQSYLKDIRVSTRLDGDSGLMRITGQVLGEFEPGRSIEVSFGGNHVHCHPIDDASGEFTIDLDLPNVRPWQLCDLRQDDELLAACYQIKIELQGQSATLDSSIHSVGFLPDRSEESNTVTPIDIPEIVNPFSLLRTLDSRTVSLMDVLNVIQVPLPDSGRLTLRSRVLFPPLFYDYLDRVGIGIVHECEAMTQDSHPCICDRLS